MGAEEKRFLVIGYGNPGRLDDGLGPALAEAIEALALPAVTVEADYQLRVEDAALIAEHDVVVFADASVDGEAPFYVERLEASATMSFSTHSLQPKALLGLARDLFQSRTSAYLLGIRGYTFNAFGERLEAQAKENLSAATAYLTEVLRQRDESLLEKRCRVSAVASSTVL